MQLFGTYTSPYVRHCRVALVETGQDYELIETDYDRSAKLAPAKRVPFLQDGDVILNDSLSILQHIRQRAGQAFLPDVGDTDLFALTNTALDTAINLFLLEKDGLSANRTPYLSRQAGRVSDILDALESRVASFQGKSGTFTEGQLRLGCFLGWGLFRKRLTLDHHVGLQVFLHRLKQYPAFAETAPPRA
ncbi:MAG: glutathione S-transferase [Gammaproteobacteria bacterium]|nr:glutathione S-transferase [Gammaproteobacteria bacterium]